MSTAPGRVTIALDGNGGDGGYQAIARAVSEVLTARPDVCLTVFGDPAMAALLRGQEHLPRLRLVPCRQNIPQDAPIGAVLRRYRQSSMYLALCALRSHEVQAVVSCGGTGPLVTLSRHLLGTCGLRPALCARLPAGPRRYTLMLDMGANSAVSSRDLLDFARLGAAAAALTMEAAQPRVSLLNVGTEEHKGSPLVREARALITSSAINYAGFIEARDLFSGCTEVIVTDGFSGNIALKAAEGVVAAYAGGRGLRQCCARLAMPRWLLPWRHNGSLLLGVDGIVVKSHAAAPVHGIAAAVRAAAAFAASGFQERLRRSLEVQGIHPGRRPAPSG